MIIIFLLFDSFSHLPHLVVFHWSLGDNKSPQISRIFLSIMDDLRNAVVWIVSTRTFISKSSTPLTNPLVTFPKAPITIGTTVTFMFHSFFHFPSKVRVLILLSAFFQLYIVVSRDNKVHNYASSFYYYHCYYFCYLIPLTVFHTSIIWWSFTEVWVKASFLKCSGLFAVFWSISLMLSFGWSQFLFLFQIFQVPAPILWRLYRAHRLHLVSLSPSCPVFFCSPARSWYLSFFSPSFIFTLLSVGKFSVFCGPSLGMFVWLRLRDLFVYKHRRECFAFRFPGHSELCIYHLLAWSNFNFLHSPHWITFYTQSCLLLYFIFTNLLLPLIMWLIDSSLSHIIYICYFLRLIYSCYDILVPYVVVLSGYQEGFSFSRKISLS